jgi:hypothetical protein
MLTSISSSIEFLTIHDTLYKGNTLTSLSVLYPGSSGLPQNSQSLIKTLKNSGLSRPEGPVWSKKLALCSYHTIGGDQPLYLFTWSHRSLAWSQKSQPLCLPAAPLDAFFSLLALWCCTGPIQSMWHTRSPNRSPISITKVALENFIWLALVFLHFSCCIFNNKK